MWKKVADLRVLSYGYPDTKGLSLYRPTRRAVKLGVQTSCSTCPGPLVAPGPRDLMLCYDLCYVMLREYPGWEINEGSSGDFNLNFETGIIELNYGQNIEDDMAIDYRGYLRF